MFNSDPRLLQNRLCWRELRGPPIGVFSRIRPNPDGGPPQHGRNCVASKEESTHVRAKDLNRQAPIVKRKKAATYFRFSSCFEFINSSNLFHVGPCCVLGHFRLSFHGQAFDDASSFRSCSFKASRRKKKGGKKEKNACLFHLIPLTRRGRFRR